MLRVGEVIYSFILLILIFVKFLISYEVFQVYIE